MPVQIRMNGFYAIRGISRKDHFSEGPFLGRTTTIIILISVGYSTSLGVPGRRRNSSVGGPTPDIIGEEGKKRKNRENKCNGK